MNERTFLMAFFEGDEETVERVLSSPPPTEKDRELGYAILYDLIGGPPTYPNIMLWYARERQKQRAQIHLVRNDHDPD